MATALKKNSQVQVTPDEVLSGEQVHQLLLDPQNPLSKAYNDALEARKAHQRIADQTAEAIQYWTHTQEEAQQQRDSLYTKEQSQKAQDDFNQGQIRYNKEFRKSEVAALTSTQKADPEISKLMAQLVTVVEKLQSTEAKLQTVQAYGQELAQQWTNLRQTIADQIIAQAEKQTVNINGVDVPVIIPDEPKRVFKEQSEQQAVNTNLLPPEARPRVNADKVSHYKHLESIRYFAMMLKSNRTQISDDGVVQSVYSEYRVKIGVVDGAIANNRQNESRLIEKQKTLTNEAVGLFNQLSVKTNSKDSRFDYEQAMIQVQVTQFTAQITTTKANVVKMGFGQ